MSVPDISHSGVSVSNPEDRDEIQRLKLKTARERCRAISAATLRFASRIESSPATARVVDLVSRSANRIEAFIDNAASNPDLRYLSESDLENHIHRVTRYIPLLHWLLGIVEHSDVTAVPAEIAALLRREIQKLFPDDSELIVTSAADLNYSIQEFSRAELKACLNLPDSELETFPRHLFVASLPSVEYDQALLHCIFGHELSHPLWERFEVESKLPPFSLSKPKLFALIDEIKRTTATSQGEFPFETIELLAKVPDKVQKATINWSKELASDLFGLLLFGPAFILTAIHFFASFDRLNSASETHPPARLRLRFLFRLLDIRYPKKGTYSPATLELLERWRSISEGALVVDGTVNELVLHTVTSSDLLNTLPHLVDAIAPDLPTYSADAYRDDLGALCPLIDANIPPAEYLDTDGSPKPASFVGIINAGWECYVRGLGPFSKNLPEGKFNSDYLIAQQYNRFLLKAMELNEAIAAWRSVTL